MKYIIILVTICIATVKAFNQEMLIIKANKLQNFYNLSFSSDDTLKYRNLFFQEFPSTFKELNSLYGETESPLYSENYNHIEVLFSKLGEINDTLYYKKLIDITIGGYWKADAIFLFQNLLQKKAFQSPILTTDLLKQRSNAEVRSFFYFFFDGIHPFYNTIPNQLLSIKERDDRIYYLMKSTLINVLEDNKNHIQH